ncbi:uncharacterized protein [Syngnathus scovelli]|uniref:uncharacterized protein isoform X1 n=1 Tax=Syngnathus scovelli TaxID=161590 RepID=UPI0035CB0245
METYQKESLRRIRRNSQMLLQDLFSICTGGRNTSLDDLTARSRKDDVYLPAVTGKASLRGNLSQSCPYLNNSRRGSFSSVSSYSTGGHCNKQNYLSAQREAKKSNVTVTMTYLGQGHRGSSRDELKVLQQVNGGENICVFKGSVTPGDQFNFISQRHRGFPFSASLYVNGIKVARISSCCEYRYSPGFQQGKKSCFRLSWLAGGMPCHRCTSLGSQYSSCQQLNNSTKESLVLPLVRRSGINDFSHSFLKLFHLLFFIRHNHSFILESYNKMCRRSLFSFYVPAKTLTSPQRRHVHHRLCLPRPKRRINPQEGQEDTSRTRPVEPRTAGTPRPLKRPPTREDVRVKLIRAGAKTRRLQARAPEGRPCPTKMRAERHLPDRTCSVKGHMALTSRTSTRRQIYSVRPDLTNLYTLFAFNCHRGDKTPKINIGFVFQDCLQDEEVLTKQKREKARESNRNNRAGDGQTDFEEQYVQMSSELEKSPSKHNSFQANMLQRRRLQKRLASGLAEPGSDVEQSEESDTILPADGEPDKSEDGEGEEEKTGEGEPLQNGDLQAQLEAMITVLSTSDEVEQLVLRNTDLTDQLLPTVADALKSSSSEVALLNLNLNLIGPDGAGILLDVLKVKPQVKSLHLFGNRLRDDGALALLSGIAELQEQTWRAAGAAANLSTGDNLFSLVELDIGGNNLSGVGLKVLASYMRQHSHLQYLGLAQTGGPDLVAWKELFDSLKGNDWLTHIILDENNLGDPGVRLLADVLKSNARLQMLDLDGNDVTDVGGNDLMEALLCRGHVPMRHLSLAENNISSALMRRIREEVKGK